MLTNTADLAAYKDPEAAAFFADARDALAPPPLRPPARPAKPETVTAEPDLSDLTGMPPSTPPDRRLLKGRSWLGTGIYLTEKARCEAAGEAERAAAAQASGSRSTEVVRILAMAENAAPAKDKSWHAARLDAYAEAHGVRGWYRKEGRDGVQVYLMVLRTRVEGDRGRYYWDWAQYRMTPPDRLLPSVVMDRDTGRVVYRAINQRIAQQWIDEAEGTVR